VLERCTEHDGRVLVVGASADELFGAAVIGLALEGIASEVVVAHLGDGGAWAPPVAAWWAEQTHPVAVIPFTGVEGFDRVYAVATAFGRDLPEEIAEHPGARTVIVGAGAWAHELEPTRRAIVERAAGGELVEAAPIPRYGRVGRALIELIEEAHHAVGPTGQSRVADALRAALFGRVGPTAVSLTTRDDPPHLDPVTLIAWFFESPR